MARGLNRRLRNPHKISPHRVAWVQLPREELILLHGTDDPDMFTEDFRPEDDVRVLIKRPGRGALNISLSSLTEKELLTLREFFLHAVEEALPICRDLDARAKEAFDAGDDAYVRLYRPVPTFYVRERGESAHAESVPDGPKPVLGLSGLYYRPGELGELRRRMVDGEPVGMEPEDDGEAPDDPA
jgi:hypothetical protein